MNKDYRIPTENVRDFILAGRAVFSLENVEKGTHVTFKVVDRNASRRSCDKDDESKKKSSGFYYVFAEMGGYEKFVCIGVYQIKESLFTKTNEFKESKYTKSFVWLLNHYVEHNRPDDRVIVYHEGKCAFCGRAMHDPESIKTGFGPKCRKLAKEFISI